MEKLPSARRGQSTAEYAPPARSPGPYFAAQARRESAVWELRATARRFPSANSHWSKPKYAPAESRASAGPLFVGSAIVRRKIEGPASLGCGGSEARTSSRGRPQE